MKFSLSILFLILITRQCRNVEGEYYDHFGSELKINSDSTFFYKFNLLETTSWSKGKWKIKNDTIYFNVVPIFDTLRIANKKDTLLLSLNPKPELITNPISATIRTLSPGAQNRMKMSLKLYIDGKKLYQLSENGKIHNTKFEVFSKNKKYRTWFIKNK